MLDFGISKAVADAKLPGTVAGTPLWMSPEQSQGGKIGFQTDVWALGLIAFYVLTGHYYWTSTDGYVGPEDLQRIERASKRAARYGCAHLIPDGFDVWFSRCVTIKPEARWADAEEARSELLKLMEESVSVQSGEPLSVPSQLIRPQRAIESAPSRIPAPRLPSSKPYFWRGLWLPYVRLAVAALFLIGVTVLLTVLATKRPPPDAAPVPVSSSTVVPPIAMPQSTGVSVPAAEPAPLPNSTRVQLRVGFLYPGSPNDHGWTATHEAGRIWVERELKQELGATQVVTFYEHTVSEADAPEKIRRMIEQKQANVIIGTSDNFRVALLEQASLHSEVRFLICSGFHASTNTGSFFGRMYQAKYLAGQIAGRATFTRRIGYVGAKPNPETISHLNAFTIGVRQQSPTAHVHVKWINDWFNPSLEKEYTTLLVKTGADIIIAGTDTTVPVETAAKLSTPDQERDGKTIIGSGKPVYSIGYGSIDACSRSNRCLTAPYWNWGPLYKRMLLSIYDHSWDRLSNEHKIIWEQIKTNHEESVVNLAPISPLRNLDTGFQIRIGEISAQMAKDDEFHKHFPFVADSVKIDGRRIMSDSKYLSDEQIRRMCWFVDGVVDDKGMRPESPPGCPGDSKPPEIY